MSTRWARSVPFIKIGEAGHAVDGVQALEIDGQFSVSVPEVTEVFEGVLPAIFG